MSNDLSSSSTYRPESTGTDPAINARVDPLLEFDAFIAPINVSGTPRTIVDDAPDGDRQRPSIDQQSAEPGTPLHGSLPHHPPRKTSTTGSLTGSVNVKEQRNTSLPTNMTSVSGTPGSVARRVKAGVDPATWLPPGWIVEDRLRNNGVTAGTVDKYYIDPISGLKFRSKKEVFEFLETGTKRRKRKAMENSDADMNTSGGSGKRKSKTSDAKPLNFDYGNVPEKVEWVLTDSLQDSWNPCIGDIKVSESCKREWMAAFAFLTAKSGRTKI